MAERLGVADARLLEALRGPAPAPLPADPVAPPVAPPARPGARGRTAVWSVSTALAGQAALVVSGPLVARCLGVQDRGHLAMVVLIPMLAAQLCQLGLPSAVTWALATGRDGKQGRLPAGLPAVMAAQMAAVSVLHALAALAITAGAGPQVRLVALVSVPTAPAMLAHMLALAALQGRGRFGAFNVLRTLPAVLYAGATLALFLTGTGSLATITAAWCGASCLVAVASVATARQATGPAGEPGGPGPGLGELGSYGLRDWLGSMSPLETFRLDQLVVGLVVSPAALGLYVVGASFSNLPRFVAQSLGAVAFPAVAAQVDPAAARRTAWRYTLAGTAACAVVVALLMAACPVALPLLFGSEFAPAVGITQLLLAGALLTGVRRVLADGLRGLGRPGAGTVGEVTTWVALVASMAVLVPAFGVTGAAAGFALSAGAGLAVLAAGLRRGTRPSIEQEKHS